MTMRTVLALAALMAAAVTLVAPVAEAQEEYTLRFHPTQNLPSAVYPRAEGHMRIRVEDGRSVVHFKVRGAYPNTVYTIWTVFNKLTWTPDQRDKPKKDPNGIVIPKVGSCPANGPDREPRTPATDPCAPGNWNGWLDFPAEGNGVAPTARMDARFTDGMGLDPGATFRTNDNGDGSVVVRLDFDITEIINNGAPVGNKDIIGQCAPDPTFTDSVCGVGKRLMRITTTWLRTFIGDPTLGDKATLCANYDPTLDPSSPQYVGPDLANGSDARLWQCIDPATGLPRVPRYGFDHFRLANHPDEMTHGFIGGNGVDHWIDMVGRREDVMPRLTPLFPKPIGQ